MIVQCGSCRIAYDDVYRFTFCPHERFEMQCMVVRGDGQKKVCISVNEVQAFLAENTLRE
mgnify:FL=1